MNQTPNNDSIDVEGDDNTRGDETTQTAQEKENVLPIGALLKRSGYNKDIFMLIVDFDLEVGNYYVEMVTRYLGEESEFGLTKISDIVSRQESMNEINEGVTNGDIALLNLNYETLEVTTIHSEHLPVWVNGPQMAFLQPGRVLVDKDGRRYVVTHYERTVGVQLSEIDPELTTIGLLMKFIGRDPSTVFVSDASICLELRFETIEDEIEANENSYYDYN